MKHERRIRNILCTLMLMWLGSALQVGAQDLVVKTNAVGWASASINGGVETHLTGRWTGGVNFSYNPWTFSENMKWKHFYVSPEVRYWLCSPFAGHFFGANLIYTHYNAGNINLPFGLSPELKEERHQGDLGGVGLFYGYSWILSNRWSIEAELGLGYGYARYKRYNCVKCGTYKGIEDKHLFMPTKAAVSIIYNIK